MKKKAILSIVFIAFIVVFLATLCSCGLFGGDSGKSRGSSSGKVETDYRKMSVKGAIEEVFFNGEENCVQWMPVDKCDYYIVNVNDGSDITIYGTKYTSIPVTDFSFSVFGVRSKEGTKTAKKETSFTLRAMSAISVDNVAERASWEEVEGATGYLVTLKNGYDGNRGNFVDQRTVTERSYSLDAVLEYQVYNLYVKPLFGRGTFFSQEGSLTGVHRLSFGDFHYFGEKGKFEGVPTTNNDRETLTYHLALNGGEEVTFSGLTYEYIPTEDVSVDFYVTSNDPLCLRSATKTFEIDYVEGVKNVAFDGEKVTFDAPYDGFNEGYFVTFVRSDGIFSRSTSATEYAVETTDVPVGYFAEVTVRPIKQYNAYTVTSDPITLYRRGSAIELNFSTTDHTAYGETAEGKNLFSVKGSVRDEALMAENGGFRLTMSGAEERVVDLPIEENAFTATYGGFLFETAGVYTVTAAPLYAFGEEVYTIGEDQTSVYTVTRSAPLAEAELVARDGKPMIKCKISSDAIDEVVTKRGETTYPTQSPNKPISVKNFTKEDGYTFIPLPVTNDEVTRADYSVTVYPRSEKISLSEYPSWEQKTLRAMTLRALEPTTVSYQATGTVPMDSLRLVNGKLTWEYGEEGETTLLQLTTNDAEGRANYLTTVRTAERTLDFSDYIADGTFAYGGKLMISIPGDPENGLFPCGQARTKTITQLTAPTLSFVAATTEYLLAKADKATYLDTENYTENDALDTVEPDLVGGSAGSFAQVFFTSDHIGKEVRFRYRSAANFVLPSVWATYTVSAPNGGASISLDQSVAQGTAEKYIRWTAQENYPSYLYAITGDVEKTETVEGASTSNLYTLLQNCVRATCHIEVQAVGYIGENNDVFLQKKIAEDDFYTVYLETNRINDTSRVAYDIVATPDGYGRSLSVDLTIWLNDYTSRRTVAVSEGSDVDVTETIAAILAEKSGNQQTVRITGRLSDSVAANYNADKAFLMNNATSEMRVTRYKNGSTITYGLNG